MQWLMTSHVRRYHRYHHTEGHVWQGRFKAFPIQADEHLLAVLRYVERNALRAGLVERAEAWRWGSLAARIAQPVPTFPVPARLELPRNWLDRVNRPQSEAEIDAIRRSIERGAPLGHESWQRRTAAKLGLEPSLRPRGRPRKNDKK
jgi:putative transposase